MRGSVCILVLVISGNTPETKLVVELPPACRHDLSAVLPQAPIQALSYLALTSLQYDTCMQREHKLKSRFSEGSLPSKTCYISASACSCSSHSTATRWSFLPCGVSGCSVACTHLLSQSCSSMSETPLMTRYRMDSGTRITFTRSWRSLSQSALGSKEAMTGESGAR